MAINLNKIEKGKSINLKKENTAQPSVENSLSKVIIGLGWDIMKPKKSGGMFGMFGSSEAQDEDFDIDASVLLLKNGKLVSMSDCVYFNNKIHSSGGVKSNGDNRTGAGDGDDETIDVIVDKIDSSYDKIVFFVTIYEAKRRNQNFGKVENTYIRAIDSKGHEIVRYEISGDASYSDKRSLIFAEMYKENGEWIFKAIGEGKSYDSVVDFTNLYK